jgi:pyruvate dehydrogenase E2 component (dihydrolipoamide acetyltransferase)
VTIVDDADLQNWSPETDITLRVIRAVTRACYAEPSLNAWYDGQQMVRQLHQHVNLGLAIDSPDGLFVPVIKNTQELQPSEIRTIINQYKAQTKDRTLPPENFRDGTITLSNFGNFAGRYANPVVVPPTVAIIGAGRIRDEVVAENGSVEIHRILPISLTFDHRAATGGEATRFLAALIADLQLSY